MPVAVGTLAAFESLVSPPEGEPRDFGDCDWQSLGSTSNAENYTVAYDTFSSDGEDEEPPDRVVFGDPNLDTEKGESVPRGGMPQPSASMPCGTMPSGSMPNGTKPIPSGSMPSEIRPRPKREWGIARVTEIGAMMLLQKRQQARLFTKLAFEEWQQALAIHQAGAANASPSKSAKRRMRQAKAR